MVFQNLCVKIHHNCGSHATINLRYLSVCPSRRIIVFVSMQGWLKNRPSDEQRSLKTLFDGSFSSLLRFVEQHLASKADYSELCTVSQTCSLLDGLLSQRDDRQTTAEYNRYERLYVFAFLWSFGILLPADGRSKLEEFIRHHDKIVLDLPPPTAGATIFDYRVENHGAS